MPKEYRVKVNNRYYMVNTNIYRETLYIIKNYRELLEQRKQLLYGSPMPPDGMPKGNALTDITFNIASVLATVNSKIEAIEKTIIHMNDKSKETYTGEKFDAYRAFESYGKFCEYRSKSNKDIAPHPRTWSRYRSEFIWNVAKRLNFF